MWKKPQELTDYPGTGYEIMHGSSDPIYNQRPTTAERALSGWQKSSGHNSVIINRSVWRDYTWNAIGIGIYKNISCVWFGVEVDPAGVPDQ